MLKAIIVNEVNSAVIHVSWCERREAEYQKFKLGIPKLVKVANKKIKIFLPRS